MRYVLLSALLGCFVGWSIYHTFAQDKRLDRLENDNQFVHARLASTTGWIDRNGKFIRELRQETTAHAKAIGVLAEQNRRQNRSIRTLRLRYKGLNSSTTVVAVR